MRKLLGIVIILFICSIGGYYFVQTNKVIDEKIKKISELDKQLSTLNEENKKLLDQDSKLNNDKNILNEKLNVFLFPENRFNEANDKFQKGFFEDALIIFNEVKDKYPCSEYAKKSLDNIIKVKESIKKKNDDEKEKERIRIEGFKAIREHKNFKSKNVKIDIGNISIGNTWSYDSNEYEYSYKTADKDSLYIKFDFTATSNIKDPKLPAIYCGIISNDGSIRKIEKFDVNFSRWSSYGSYLGNYHDATNDFSKRKTIKFTSGVQIKKTYINNNSIILFTNLDECVNRVEREYGSPPAFYSSYFCKDVIGPIDVTEFSKKYTMIKILNNKKR